MWWSRKKPSTFTPEEYLRWILAGKPPFDMFMAMPEEEQQALADIHQGVTEDLCIAIGYAVLDPQRAEKALGRKSSTSEEDLIREVAMDLFSRIAGKGEKAARSPSTASEPLSMVDAIKKRKESPGGLDGIPPRRRRLFGRDPDEPNEENDEPLATGTPDPA